MAQLLGLAMLGWLVPEVSLKAAILVPIDWPCVVLTVFALGFLGTLVCTVLMIRMAASHAVRRRAGGTPGDGRGATQVLASTLLPFLGVYAAFDHVQERPGTGQPVHRPRGYLRGHPDQPPRPFTSPRLAVPVLLLIVGTYVVRRLVELVHDRGGWRPLGFLVVVLESYFLLVVLLAGKHFVKQVGR